MDSFLTQMLDALERERIDYCLMRDADRVTELAGGGEIDMLVQPGQMREFEHLLLSLGFVRLPIRGYEPHLFFLCYNTSSNSWYKLDVITEIAFGSPGEYLRTPLADNCLRNRRRLQYAYAPSPEDEIVCLLLHCVLDKENIAPHRSRRLRALRREVRDPEYLSKLLAAYWLPDTDWDELAHQIDAEDWLALLSQRNAIERHLARYGQLAARVRETLRRARRLQSRFRAFFVPTVPSVALLGPDGAGKSTLAAGLARCFCMPVDQLYMGLYPKATRKKAPLPGLGFAGLLLKQWKRYLEARYRQAGGHLVVFDRYPYDALLPARQPLGLLRRARRWLLAHACPGPDLVMVLDAPGEVLHARKGEHTVELLEDQRRSYRRLQVLLPRVTVVDASRDAEHVQRQVNTVIWQSLGQACETLHLAAR